ncbi:MAG TPA: choice-of-anchor tandem repeat GloVer-containing protein [Candidatus Cybelea sp.]|jgi:uncharacterized repeat protein (TIGR03803 family)|nr:choice-of-anchor tandem repeat GloVer-containing protein [Candidatus Cybelea sp.]
MNQRYTASTICLSTALLTSCTGGGGNPPAPAGFALPNLRLQSAREAKSTNYRIVTDFSSVYDGSYPAGGLLDVKGTLYGSTVVGGAFGQGNVFSLSTTGTENVLHSFGGPLDGSNPEGTLVDVNGTLYGMAPGDGVYNWGVIYAITRSGGESVLYSLHGSPNDGADGQASVLIYVKRKFYGLTTDGGKWGRGTVFSLTPTGSEKVLHSFYGGQSDGAWPDGGLVYLNGLLYGTTTAGGSQYASRDIGDGVVFSITPTGTENILYSFPYGGSQGCCPNAGLVNINGTLYGTAAGGGPNGGGIAFSITTGGTLTDLHDFGKGSDGSGPTGPPIDVKGVLYGTTSGGGAYRKGTVYRMTLSGSEKVLHSFGDGSDGATPIAGVTALKETLYGTTSGGGANGNGTVFALKL